MELLKIDGFGFRYNGAQESVIKDLTLTVNRGEFITIFGTNGSGKTTLLKNIKASIAPAGKRTGSICFDGLDIFAMSQQDQATRIGYIFQNPDNQIVCDDCIHELAFGLENIGLSREEIHSRLAEVCNFLGIQGWIDRKVDTLSGGEKQILNLASVIALRPDLLLLDEPISQLDSTSQEHFIDLLKKLNDELNITVIICEHRLDELLSISDRAVFMDMGRIVAEGRPENVLRAIFELDERYRDFLPSVTSICASLSEGNDFPLTLKAAAKLTDRYTVGDFSYENGTDEKQSVIKVKDVTKRYERHGKDILDSVCLELGKGEIVSVVGGNGSGKSTLLRCIAGVEKVQYGKIVNRGASVRMLPQNVETLFKADSVEEELKGYCTEQTVRDVYDIFELDNVRNRHPFDLSGGEQQKLALAILYLTDGDVLLLDEPTKNLDVSFKERFLNILEKLAGKGHTILIVSHDLEFCARISDRVGMLFNGELTMDNDVHHFFSGNTYYTTPVNRLIRNRNRFIINKEEMMGVLKKA
ncbi:MAG: ABC transporter ATP-binding protein [Clostridia bacterium]|nr:ABC transporter ATP-binding protein [Clostridia bacterium]